MVKAISIFLSLLMLASSSGIAYAQHFCGGMEMMSKITLGDLLLNCGMEDDTSDLHCVDGDTVLDSYNCCKNHITKVQTDDNFAKTSFDLKLDKLFVASLVSVLVVQNFEIQNREEPSFAEYNPPPLVRELNILYETFLI